MDLQNFTFCANFKLSMNSKLTSFTLKHVPGLIMHVTRTLKWFSFLTHHAFIFFNPIIQTLGFMLLLMDKIKC